MPDIRYVCLSDMHLGEEDSLLTNLEAGGTGTDPAQPSPVMVRLVGCLRYLISRNEDDEKPTLILNGDILELALTTTNQAAMAFERFMELAMPPGGELFERIIYIPGNHDHHIWEIARETQYVNYISRLGPGEHLPIPWHTTNMFVENDPTPVPSYLLTKLVRRFPHLKDFTITVAYPNFGLVREDGRRCVIFHHGHFIESLYQLMSTLKALLFPGRKMPTRIYDMEAENFAWIDFFWSTMGRSGDAGRAIESIYERMRNPGQFRRLLSSFADSLAEKYDLPGWGDWMESRILKEVLYYLADKVAGRERVCTDLPLSEDAGDGLRTYVSGPLREQILTERGGVPPDVIFVFGHTHKPFQECLDFKGYPRRMDVYNTGGWVVDTVERRPVHGGAVILVDGDLNVTALRMYNEMAKAEEYSVSVEVATRTGGEANPFHRRISELVDPSEEPWRSFSSAVARAVYVRARDLRARMNEVG